MTRLVALKNTRYGTRALKAGDCFDAEPRYALTMKLMRLADDAPAEEVPAKRGRGRPRKHPRPDDAGAVAEDKVNHIIDDGD